MLTLVLKFVGWSLAHLPEAVLRGLSRLIGTLMYGLLARRRHLALSNLSHAFPSQPDHWLRETAQTSMIRLIETALLSLASPFLSTDRLRRIAQAGPGLESMLVDRATQPRPTVLASLHLAYWECQPWLGLLSSTPIGNFSVIYRPLDDPTADAFVRKTRERFGMRLLSRKEGFAQALKTLRNQGCVGLLFDQNAGMQGALTTLFGRVCSTTELPGILAEKYGAEVRIIYPRRKAFWRVELHVELLTHNGTAEGITVALNQWLEAKLSDDTELCRSWLWSHARWRHQDVPSTRLRLQSKRNLLDREIALRGWSELPRRTRIVVRLPNWLGDVVMALPLLLNLRTSRPDASISLVGRAHFEPLMRELGIPFEHYVSLPAQGIGYWSHFLRLRSSYPDVYLLFTNSLRSDLEAWMTGCRQRFGIERPGHPRFLLSHRYRRPRSWNESTSHQLSEWQRFFEEFGLSGPISRQPVRRPAGVSSATSRRVGLIVGSENTPAKRWPLAKWMEVTRQCPEITFVALGTATDRRITDDLCRNAGGAVIENLAGKTTLAEFCRVLGSLDLLVSNDTGGMHLANALGVPVIALFGPTNPLRTGPVFDAPVTLLQPPGCPPAGGGSLDDLAAETVLQAIRHSLANPADRD